MFETSLNAGQILTIVLIVWIMAPLLAAFLSSRKKRDTNFWVLACTVMPLLVLFLLFLPKRDAPPRRMFGDERPHDDSFFPHRD